MTKVEQNPELFKVEVESYREDGNKLHCVCFIDTVECNGPEYRTIITMQELKSYACDCKAGVYMHTDKEIELVTFEQWYEQYAHTEQVHNTLADLINRKEKRRLTAFENQPSQLFDAFAALGSILRPGNSFINRKTA